MKPQSVPPWAKESTGLYTRYMALTRAIRANDNRARYARDPDERAHYLEANQVLEKKRAELAHKPPRQKDKNKAQSP